MTITDDFDALTTGLPIEPEAPYSCPEPGCYPDIPMAAYVADPCTQPSLSPSVAHLLATKSPRHAWYAHQRLGMGVKESTDATLRGSFLHDLLLEGGKRIQVVDAPDFRTKAAKLERDAAFASGLIPMVRSKFDEATRITDAIREGIVECGLQWWTVDDAMIEHTLVWVDYDHGARGVLCRCRPDVIFRDGNDVLVVDIKTTQDAAPDAAAGSMTEYGYDIQGEANVRACEANWPECVGRVRVVYLFCETEAPFVVSPIAGDGAMREMGKRRWERALGIWARCLEKDSWPAYGTAAIEVTPRAWVMQREDM